MRRIVCVGDTHVGSECGLWPDGFRTPAGNIISMNKTQIELWGSWLRFLNEEKVRIADRVLLLGDLCQGNNRKRWGAGTVTSDYPRRYGPPLNCCGRCAGGNWFTAWLGAAITIHWMFTWMSLSSRSLGEHALGSWPISGSRGSAMFSMWPTGSVDRPSIRGPLRTGKASWRILERRGERSPNSP